MTASQRVKKRVSGKPEQRIVQTMRIVANSDEWSSTIWFRLFEDYSSLFGTIRKVPTIRYSLFGFSRHPITTADSIGYRRTRPVSLCVGWTDRKSDRERLSKIHWSVYRGCEMLAQLLHRTQPVFSGVYLTDWHSDRQILTKQAHKTCVYIPRS